MKKVIVIVGPTCVGKTKLSIELAKKLNGEVINADSTQVYKDNDIATAKVTKEEMENIKHHLLSFKNLDEDYTVYDYQKDARRKIEDIIKRDKTPILVGGTGLYIKACLYDYNFSENVLNQDYSMFSNDELYQKLLELEPNTTIHKNNRRRVERRITLLENGYESQEPKQLYDAYFIGLTTSRDILYNKINARTDLMIKNGLLNEAKKIYDLDLRTKAVLTPIGYKELFPYFDGNDTLENCIEKIKQNSRRYAKRQYTWFRHQMDVNWFDVNFDNFDKTVLEVIDFIERK